MTIKEALKLHRAIENELLLTHVLGKPKEFLFLNPDKSLKPAQERLFMALAKRRLRGEPIAYILGYKYFCGLKFIVDKNVLIPRPETEWLVERAVAIISRKIKDERRVGPPRVFDLGTGSGCVAISLAKKIRPRRIEITASDVSGNALLVAQKNARLNRAKIKFLKSDLFNDVKGSYDLIIANLPYVPTTDYAKLKDNLKYEPKGALTDGTNNFRVYGRFLNAVKSHLKKNGSVLMEIDPAFKKSNLAKGLVFHKDLRGLWRYAESK